MRRSQLPCCSNTGARCIPCSELSPATVTVQRRGRWRVLLISWRPRRWIKMPDRLDAHPGNTPLPIRGAFGPWLRALGDCERCAQLRSLAALAAVFVGSANPLVTALRRAEQDDSELARAFALLEA